MLAHITTPQWGEDKSAAPAIVRGYPVQNAAGRWVWSSSAPGGAAVITNVSGRLELDVGGSASAWKVALTAGGKPNIYGA